MPENRQYNDSIKRGMKDYPMYLSMQDTIGTIGRSNTEDLYSFIKTYLQDADSTYLIHTLPELAACCQWVNLKLLEDSIHLTVTKETRSNKNYLVGTFQFSNIIFNKAKNKAALFCSCMQGKGGFGALFLLEKQTGQWRISREERTWVA